MSTCDVGKGNNEFGTDSGRDLKEKHLLQAQQDDAKLDLDALFPEYLSESTVLMEGILEKRGHWNPAWKSRYFVLESNGRLSYFMSKDDKILASNAKGIIPIDNKSKITCEGQGRDGRNIIKIQVPGKVKSAGRTFVLSSSCRAICDQWLHHLSELQSSIIYTSIPKYLWHG